MFADLNMHAVRPSRSLGVLYDHRGETSQLARRLVDEVNYFKGLTELEKTSISNRSVKLFTLSSIHQAACELLGKKKSDSVSTKEARVAVQFWSELGKHMPDWERAARREIDTAELRRDYIHPHGVVLQALAIAGTQLLALYPSEWKKRLTPLASVDWSRSNTQLWEGRAMIGGRLNKARNNVVLVANVILRTLDLPLTPEGERVEQKRAERPSPQVAHV